MRSPPVTTNGDRAGLQGAPSPRDGLVFMTHVWGGEEIRLQAHSMRSLCMYDAVYPPPRPGVRSYLLVLYGRPTTSLTPWALRLSFGLRISLLLVLPWGLQVLVILPLRFPRRPLKPNWPEAMTVAKSLCLAQTISSMHVVRYLLDFGKLLWTILNHLSKPRCLSKYAATSLFGWVHLAKLVHAVIHAAVNATFPVWRPATAATVQRFL